MTNVFKKQRTQAQSPFEKERAREVGELYRQGVDPLTVNVHSSGGSYRYSYDDIANYHEQYETPFLMQASLHQMKKVGNHLKRIPLRG